MRLVDINTAQDPGLLFVFKATGMLDPSAELTQEAMEWIASGHSNR